MKKIILAILFLQLITACNHPENSGVNTGPEGVIQVSDNAPDTLTFTVSDGHNIIFKAILDQRDTLNLFFDTGGTELVLTHSAIKERTGLLDGKNEHYQEQNYVPLEGFYPLTLGNLSWDSLAIYPTKVGPKEADGHFGWDLFKDKIVELDYDQQLMIVHSAFSGNLEEYVKLEIEYINTLFCIQSSITVGDKEYPNRYLFDSGFQRAVVLDKDLRQKSHFPDNLPVIKESRLKNAAGTEFINRVVVVDAICFGNSCTQQVPVQLLSTPNPARFETHILGNELLKRFNTVLDFQHHFVYMKPNSLMKLPYQDAL